MVGIIGSCVILVDVNFSITDRSSPSPVEITEVNDEIRWDVLNGTVDILGLKNPGSNGLIILISQGLKLLFEMIPEGFVLSLGD